MTTIRLQTLSTANPPFGTSLAKSMLVWGKEKVEATKCGDRYTPPFTKRT